MPQTGPHTGSVDSPHPGKVDLDRAFATLTQALEAQLPDNVGKCSALKHLHYAATDTRMALKGS